MSGTESTKLARLHRCLCTEIFQYLDENSVTCYCLSTGPNKLAQHLQGTKQTRARKQLPEAHHLCYMCPAPGLLFLTPTWSVPTILLFQSHTTPPSWIIPNERGNRCKACVVTGAVVYTRSLELWKGGHVPMLARAKPPCDTGSITGQGSTCSPELIPDVHRISQVTAATIAVTHRNIQGHIFI